KGKQVAALRPGPTQCHPRIICSCAVREGEKGTVACPLLRPLEWQGKKDYRRCVRISLQVLTRWTFGWARGCAFHGRVIRKTVAPVAAIRWACSWRSPTKA